MAELGVVVLIPAYQPNHELIQVVDGLQGHCPIVIVDDGSGEDSCLIFEQAEEKGAIIVHHAVNLGKGRALKTGFNEIMQVYPEYAVVTADADGQHCPEDILKVVEALQDDPDRFVFGGRSFQTMPARSKIGNTIMRFFFRLGTGCSLSDTQTGLRGIPAFYLPAMMELKGERYEYEMSLLMELRDWNADYIEILISTLYFNGNQQSHFHGFKDGIRVFGRMLRYCLTSATSAGTDYGLYLLFLWLPVGFLTPSRSFVLARICSCVVNYMGNRYFVFKQKKTSKLSILLYVALIAFGIIVGSGGIWLLTQFKVPALIAKIIMDSLLFFVNFYVQKNFIFVDRSKPEKTGIDRE